MNKIIKGVIISIITWFIVQFIFKKWVDKNG